MKLPFLNSLSSCSSNSSSTNSSSWPWPSCNQNPKTVSFRATISITNQEEDGPAESVENVLKRIKSSERLIFESIGESNSILEESMTKRVEEEGFILLSLESKDPYSDFKRSMEEMVEAHALHHDSRTLEKLLIQFLRVNAKTSHPYIYAAFVDLLFKLALNTKTSIKNNNFATVEGVSASRAGEASTSCCMMSLGESPSSPFSFYTSSSSYSSSDETSSASVRFLPLSALLEMEEKTNDILV